MTLEVRFYERDVPDITVATVVWNDGRIEIDSADDVVRAALAKTYRRTPVVTDDAAYRRLGTHGEVVLQPGDLEWFRAVSQVRAPTGLVARLIPGVTEGGYDPAAGYRSFEDSIDWLQRGGSG